MKTRYWLVIIIVLIIINISTITYYEVDKRLDEELKGYSSKFYYEIKVNNRNNQDFSFLLPLPIYHGSKNLKYIPDFMENIDSENDSISWKLDYNRINSSNEPFFRISGSSSDIIWIEDESEEIEPYMGLQGYIEKHYFDEILPIGNGFWVEPNQTFSVINEMDESNIEISVELDYHLSTNMYNGFETPLSSSGTRIIITGSGEMKDSGWNQFPLHVQAACFD